MPIPRPVKSLFDSVPVITYKNDSGCIPARNVYQFQGLSKGKFILGVYNLFSYEETFIPTDPISLGICLILLSKNELKLPIEQGSGSGIMMLSHNSSSEKVLPILIEDDEKRIIRQSSEILKSVSKNSDDKLIVDLIDYQFFDTFILCLLNEVDDEILKKMFNIDSFEIFEFKKQIASWNDLDIRYPNVDFEELYKLQLREFETNLNLIQNIDNNVITSKVTGFVVIINHFLKHTQLGGCINDSINEKCTTFINSYR